MELRFLRRNDVLREEDGSVIQVPNNPFLQKMFMVASGQRSRFEMLELKTDA